MVERRVTAADFSDFASALGVFLDENPGHTITQACFALAGPVAAGQHRAALTNLPWVIDAEAIGQRFNLPRATLVNDFAAAAMGAVTAPAESVVTLQAGSANQRYGQAPRLVVGAGTGLGMAIVLPESQQQGQGQRQGWRILAGEGGHVAFAPANEQQAELWHFLHRRYGRVTWERVVSGPGLSAIHEFLTGEILAPEVIAQANSVATAHSLGLFLAAYGAFTGDMALASMAQGGVYLAGGIAAKILPALQGAEFMTAFCDKAEHRAIVSAIPVHVCIDPSLGLRGAALLACCYDGYD